MTVIVLTVIVTSSYREAVEAATILGILLPSAVAVATAVFGVAQTRKTDEAEKRTSTAEQDASTVRARATAALSLLESVDPGEAFGVAQGVGSSPAGATSLTVQPVDGSEAKTLDLDEVVRQRVNFQQAKALLAEVVGPSDPPVR